MKKLLTLATVAVMILGLAAATYALELRANGFIWEFAGVAVNNGGMSDPTAPISHYPTAAQDGWNDSAAAVAMWARLQFTLEASEDLKGVYHFEIGGPGPTFWGTDGGYGQWQADNTDVFEMKQAYIDFKVPGIDALPMRMQVGIQPWVFSPQLISDEDGPGVNLATTVGPAAVKVAWAKMYEGVGWRSDDVDRYTATATFPAGPITAGIWSSYYAIRDTSADFGALYPGGDTTGNSGYAWYTALNARGKAGPVDFWADFAYGTGKIDVDATDNELSCWIVRANASIPVGMFTVGGEFLYGSSGDNNDIATGEWTGWVKPPGHDGIVGNASLIYYKSYYSILAGFTTSAQDEWYAKGFARFKPLDWMTVTAQGMYIGDNRDHGNVHGNARVAPFGATDLEDEDDVGIEVDLFVDIPVYDNLLLQFAGGILFAGSALDTWDGVSVNDEPDDPWAITTKLSFNF